MLRFAQQVGRQVGRKLGRLVRDEHGQNVIETALIIGVVSLVLVLGFMGTGVLAAVQDVGNSVVCEAQGGTWTPGAGGTAGACS